MRTLVDLPEEQIKGLDTLAAAIDTSRAELVRRAIAAFLQEQLKPKAPVFGILKGQEVDGLALQKKLREDR